MVKENFLWCAGLLALFVLPACTLAQSSGGGKTNDDPIVKLSLKETPNIKFGNEPNIEKGGPSKWLVAEVEFVTSEKKVSRDKYNWIDDLRIQFDILIPSSYNGRGVTAMLSGETIYWGIPLDGKQHLIDGFVPPQIIHRYLRDGSKLSKGMLDDFNVRVSIYTKDKRLLARYYNAKKEDVAQEMAQRFTQADDGVTGGVIRVKEAVYARNKTPWQYVNFGSMDLIKPDESK